MKTPTVLYYISSGLLFSVVFTDVVFWWACIPAFVLFYRALERTRSYRKVFAGGLIVGTGIYLGSFFWVWSSIPVMWIHDQPLWVHIIAVLFYWILTSVVSGMGSAVFALLAKKLMHSNIVFVCAVPVVWVCSEILRSLIFSVYTWGPGSHVNADFSFGYIGYALAGSSLTLPFAAVAGVYGLSYLASLFGCVTYVLCCRASKDKKEAVLICAVVVALFCGLLSLVSSRSTDALGIKVVSLDTVFDKHFNTQDDAQRIKEEAVLLGVQQALSYAPHTVILPEDVRISDYFTSADAVFDWIDLHASDATVSIVDNGPEIDARGKQVIRTYVYDRKERSVYFFDKKYLVPQGEFMSYFHSFVIDLFIEKSELQAIHKETGMYAGVMNDSESLPSHLPGVLFCFETMVPLSVKRIESMRSHPFIAHSISHSWFAEPDTLEYQLDAMMKVHAVWNNIPIISAGNMADGALYLPVGTIDAGVSEETTPYWTVRSFEL